MVWKSLSGVIQMYVRTAGMAVQVAFDIFEMLAAIVRHKIIGPSVVGTSFGST